MKKSPIFPPQTGRTLGSARTSEIALGLGLGLELGANAGLGAGDAVFTSPEAAPAPSKKSSYRMSASGEKVVRAPHALRYIHF